MVTETRVSIEELVQRFLSASGRKGHTEATLVFYRDNLARFAWWLKEAGIPSDVDQAITTDVINRFLDYIMTAPIRWGGRSNTSRRPASKSTVDAYWRTLQALCAWMDGQEIFWPDGKNPFNRTRRGNKVERPQVEERIIADIPPDLIRQAVEQWDPTTFAGCRNQAIILLFIDSILRLRELANIQVQDIDFPAGRIKVLGKGNKERYAPFGQGAAAALQSYLQRRQEVAAGSPWLWLQEDGERYQRGGIQIMIRRMKKLGGNVRWSPHTFRHTGAGMFLDHGGDPFSLQEVGGWVDLEMPNRYSKARKTERALLKHKEASPIDNMMSLPPSSTPNLETAPSGPARDLPQLRDTPPRKRGRPKTKRRGRPAKGVTP